MAKLFPTFRFSAKKKLQQAFYHLVLCCFSPKGLTLPLLKNQTKTKKMKDTEASVHVTAFLLEGDQPRKTVSQLKHECKSFVHALVFSLVTEG